LTFNIALYQLFYNHMQAQEDAEHCHGHGETPSPGLTNDVADNKESPLIPKDEE
jgi:hypothetical protein